MTMTVLLYRAFQRSRGLVLTLAGVLAVFQVLVVLAASYLRESEAFSQLVALLPPVVQQMAGSLFAGFDSVVAFGYFHPVVIAAVVGLAIVVASEPAADVESGMVDLLLARPIGRWVIIVRSLVMTTLAVSGTAMLMVASSRLSIRLLAPADTGVSTQVLATLAANLVALAWFIGALSLAVASVVRRRAVATGTAAVAALVLYLLNFLAEIWPDVEPLGVLSPFHYYQPTRILAGTDTRWVGDVSVLVIGAAVLSAVAVAAFNRRDV
ncbi:MAG: hypothetical protein ACT4QD_10305 [Acidobacteriota bacterium]